MTIGIVKFFNATQGYGFIRPEGGSSDVFLHASAVDPATISSLSEGREVSFDIQSVDGSLAAVNLQLV